MSTPIKKKRNVRGTGSLFEKGAFTAAIGLCFLILPWLLKSGDTPSLVQEGLRIPGWIGLGVGLVLLRVDRWKKHRETLLEKEKLPTT